MTLNSRAIVFIMLVKTIMVCKNIFPIDYLIAVAVLHNMNVSSFPLEHLITWQTSHGKCMKVGFSSFDASSI